LRKNNKYKEQIEYKTLTLTHGTSLGWHVCIFFQKKNWTKFDEN